MSKQFTIGKGNNLGQNQFMRQDESLDSFYYRGTLQDKLGFYIISDNQKLEELTTDNQLNILNE